MQKNLFLTALVLGALLSCKKSGSGNASYHMTATVNGKSETFSAATTASRTNINNATYIAIVGMATSSAAGESIMIGLSSKPGGPAIKAGTYMDTTTLFDVDAIYQVSMNEMYNAGSSVYQGTQGGGVSKPITNHFKLVVTAMDSTSIRGTFSGDFFRYGSTDSARKTITEGDYYAKFY